MAPVGLQGVGATIAGQSNGQSTMRQANSFKGAVEQLEEEINQLKQEVFATRKEVRQHLGV